MAEKPFFVIPTPLGTVTSGNEAENRPASHLGEFAYRGMVWESDGATDLWLQVDLGESVPIDFVSIMGANAQPGTQLRIRIGDSQAEVMSESADHDTAPQPFISPSITRADGLYHSHHELDAPISKRWLQFDISGHTGDFSASMLVIGKKITPGMYYEGRWNRDIRDLGSVTFSRSGVPGVARGARLRAMGFTLAWLSEAEMEETFSPLDEYVGKTEPVYVCFDPEATTSRQRRTLLGYFEELPSFTKLGFNRFERKFQILSLF